MRLARGARWLAVALAAACGGAPALLGPGEECSLAVDCAPGLVCVPERGGVRRCSNDLSTVGGDAPVAVDGAAGAGDGAAEGGSVGPPPGPAPDGAPPPEEVDAAAPPGGDAAADADSGDGG